MKWRIRSVFLHTTLGHRRLLGRVRARPQFRVDCDGQRPVSAATSALMWRAADLDGSGYIDLGEFLELAEVATPQPSSFES